MKKIGIITILLVKRILLIAQTDEKMIEDRPLNSININLLGDASLIGLNYEKQFLLNPNFILSSKLGIGYNEEFEFCIFGPCTSTPKNFLTIPHHITANLGKGKHFFEVGLGVTAIQGNTRETYLLYPLAGYRFLPLKSGLNFRIFGLIPFSGFLTDDDILISPVGLNFGVSF